MSSKNCKKRFYMICLRRYIFDKKCAVSKMRSRRVIIHKKGIVKYTSLFTKYTPYTTPILHHNMVCTTNIAPSYLQTTTIAQHSASIVRMVSDLPSNLRFARNGRLKIFAFVNDLIDDPGALLMHPTFLLKHPIRHTHTEPQQGLCDRYCDTIPLYSSPKIPYPGCTTSKMTTPHHFLPQLPPVANAF